MGKSIFSSQTVIEYNDDLDFDVLEFTDDGGLIIEQNICVNVNTLMIDESNEGKVQFTFTTGVPIYTRNHAGASDTPHTKAAKLVIQDLQSDITVVNVGCNGSNGGRGGEGASGSSIPPGAKNSMGGCGGSGGNGGDASDGGDGPELTITYKSSNDSGMTVLKRQSVGGTGGEGGNGARGGKNSDGTYAPNGANGAHGRDGNKGNYGNVLLNGFKV